MRPITRSFVGRVKSQHLLLHDARAVAVDFDRAAALPQQPASNRRHPAAHASVPTADYRIPGPLRNHNSGVVDGDHCGVCDCVWADSLSVRLCVRALEGQENCAIAKMTA